MEISSQRQNNTPEEARASDPVDRLLEDSWETRSRRASARELISETVAAGLFLVVAGALAAPALARHHVDLGFALLLVALYAVVARGIKFPLGAGYVVPSYLVLAPMLLLLPPGIVPLLAAAGLLLGTAARVLARRGRLEELLFAVPDAWHTVGPAAVLWLAESVHGATRVNVYLIAFLAGCVLDLISSSLRESFALGIAPRLQVRVLALVWVIDACIAPLGLLLGEAARRDHSHLLALLPLSALLVLLDRDRTARIAEAQRRLALVGRERTRLQAAVSRLGEAFAAKLDVPALTTIALRGSIDALDADAGQLTLHAPNRPTLIDAAGDAELAAPLQAAIGMAQASARPEQIEQDGVWVLALPFGLEAHASAHGVLAVARRTREFRPDEQTVMLGLAERAHAAVCDILLHETLREQAITDPLTGLGNRRKLANDLEARLADKSPNAEPVVLMLFDLDGFKNYNDTFGHLAGDALLTRLGAKLAAAACAPRGAAYRLGGDEFCALLPARGPDTPALVARAAGALCECGETFSIKASCGAVLLPHEANSADYALQLADERMYAHKQSRPLAATEQTRDVLVRIMQAKQPELPDHSTGVARLAASVGRRLGLNAEQLDELARAAELYDIGKVGIPDAILDKPGELDDAEWEFMRQHTILGERILSAAPALRPVAKIVRASHERWDGTGYPDRLRGDDIPLAARIVAVCDAYEAITGDRRYREARAPEAAREELVRGAGRQFDPAVVAAFLEELDAPQPEAAPTSVSSDEDDAAWQLATEVTDRLGQILIEFERR
jgi:diguanylate cyclase (GGDEF)-like protein